jgi:hypothetical protein
MKSINIYYDNENNVRFLHTCLKQNIQLCLEDLNSLNLRLDNFIKKFIKKEHGDIDFTYINAFYLNDNLYVNIEFKYDENILTLRLADWKNNIYNITEMIDHPKVYYTYIPGEKIDDVQYNYYWNDKVFTYATFDFTFAKSKFELLIKKQGYSLSNVIPVFNAKNVFIFELNKHESDEKIFLLLKDNKLFEFKLEEKFVSITLDVYTYKLYGIDLFDFFKDNIEYKLVETTEYFEQLI